MFSDDSKRDKICLHRDDRCRYYVWPVKITWSNPGAGKIISPESLLKNDFNTCTIHISEGRSPAMVLDFGQEFNGGIEINFTTESPASIAKTRIRFGESVSEVMNNPNNDHCIHDVILDMSVWGKHEFGNTGFRFVRLDFLSCDVPVSIESIKLIALQRPYEYLGSFESSDAQLNEIWRVGARTVHLCCQEYILDGIKRDRLLWAGDLHPQIHVIGNVFGSVDVVYKTLDQARLMAPPGSWINDICSYSLWWIVCVMDWYMYTGNIEWLRKQTEYLEQLVDRIISYIDNEGNVSLRDKIFIDWVIGLNNPTVLEEGIQAMVIYGLQKASDIFQSVGSGAYFNKTVKALLSLKNTTLNSSAFKQVNALRALAGAVSPKEANLKSLSVDPCHGLSPWFAYIALQVRSLAKDTADAIKMVKKYWGGMLELGATTFWEHFDVDWLLQSTRIDEMPQKGKTDVHADCGDHCFKGLRHSFCHGWSGGPTAWMSQYILGVRPTTAGFKEVIIDPDMGSLEYVKGEVPTPHGILTVEASQDRKGKVELKYEIPDNVSIQDK